jgi:nucleoside-diphosphate-sugar epimerase
MYASSGMDKEWFVERVLVTGGAGYLGSILIPDLLSDGYSVTVLDNFMYRQNSLAAACINPNLNIVVGDIRDRTLMKKLVSSHDVVIPLAAIVGAPACNRDVTAAESINLHAALNLIEISSKDQQIIMPTTNSAYGTTKPGEISFETSKLNPISSYAKHKVEVESALMENSLNVSFRLATVFGMSPRMRLDLLVNDLCYRAIHEKSVVLFEADFVRNYVHVRDVSRVLRWAIGSEVASGEVFNFGLTEANLSKKDLCAAIQKHLPSFIFLEAEFGKDPDQRNYIVSNSKIESTGFIFEYGLNRGLEELIKGLVSLKNSIYSNV